MKSSKDDSNPGEASEEHESRILIEIGKAHTVNVMASRGEAVIKAETATVINVQHLEGIMNAAVSEEVKREAINHQSTLWANSQPTQAESHVFTVTNNTQDLPPNERVEVIKNAINHPAVSLASPQEKSSLAQSQFTPVALPEKCAHPENAYNLQAQQSSGEGIHLQAGSAGQIQVKKVTKHININLPQPPSPAIKGNNLEKNSLVHFEELTIEGEATVAKYETVISRELSIDDILKYEAGSADIDYNNDKRRQLENIPERRLLTATKGHVAKEGRMNVRRSILKDGGNTPQQKTSSTLFFNSESIAHRCINEQHIVEIKYNLLKLTEGQRVNLQTVLRGRDGLEAFEAIPNSVQERRGCITQLAFESAYSAKNLIIALKQSLASYQKVSFSPEERFSDAPWLEAITYKGEAGGYVVMIDYPPLRLTQAERARLHALLQKTKVDDFDCEPEKTVTLKDCIQQLVFVSEESAQTCIAELHAAMENGLREDEIFQEGADESRKQATTGASLVTVQEAKIAPSLEVSQEPLQHGGLPNLTHQGSAQIGYLQAHSLTVIGEQRISYEPNPEDKERGAHILNNPELFYNPKPWGMLPKTNPHFVGREEKLNELKTSFNQANQSAAVVINQRRLHRQAVNSEQSQASANKTAQGVLGLGGVGKTQLAAEYVYTLLDAEEDKPANTTPLERQYALIVWLRGQRILLEQDLRRLAVWAGLVFDPKTPIEQIAQALYDRLANLSRPNQGQSRPRVLWIVDDAHWEDSLQELLPQPQQAYQGCFHWLLTSREQHPWKKYFGETFKPCVLGVFTKEEAQLYLDTALKPEVKQQADYTENCEWLIQQMGRLPLALAQASAYINQLRTENALAKYCRLFQDQGEDLVGSDIEANDERTVLFTWLITLSALLSEETLAQGQGALAIYLLLNCAYCDGASIPVELLAAFHSHQDASRRPNEVQIENAVRCLVNYSLATRLDDGSIQVHQLVQQVLRWWMGKQLTPQSQALTKKQGSQVSELESELQQAHIDKEQVLAVLVGNFIDYTKELGKKFEIKPKIALVPHLTTLIGYWQVVNEKASSTGSQEKMAWLYFYLGNIQYIQGNASASKASFQYALDFFEQCSPKDPPYVAATLTNLGTAYGALGDTSKQKALLERALVIKESHYGEDHYEVAITLTSLGSAYGALGDVLKEKALLERALVIQESYYGEYHYEVAKTLANLGSVYGALGVDALKLKALLEPVLVILESHYGKDDYHVAATLHNLGNTYGALGEVLKKKAFLERALAIKEAHYGKDHYEVAGTLTSLGSAYGALGNVLKEKELLERALVINESHYGKDHYQVAKTLFHLGIAYHASGDALKAKAFLERALVIDKAHYGKDHYEVAGTLVALAYSELSLGHPQIALTKAQHCLQIFQASEESHRHTKMAQGLIKQCEQALARFDTYKARGDVYYFLLSEVDKAVAAYKQALEYNSERYDLYHDLACFYFIQGDTSEADMHFQVAMARHPTPEVLVEYSHFLVKQNRIDEALDYLQQCLTGEEGKVSYGLIGIHTVVAAIANMIEASPSVSFDFSAHGLALYLQAYCHLAKKTDESICRYNIELFAQWVESTYQQQQASAAEQASYYFLLGDSYEQFEEENQARVYYERACQLNPRFVRIVKGKFTPCYRPTNQEAFNTNQEAFQTRLGIPLQETPQSLERLFRCAAAQGELESLRNAYENRGVSVDAQDNNPRNLRTALHWACIHKHEGIIDYLLAQDARFDIEDAQGKMAWEYELTPAMVALFKKNPDRLLKKYQITLFPGFDGCWNQLLESAIKSDCLADIRYCIEVLGVDVNVENVCSSYQRRPLHWAVIHQRSSITRYLRNYGARDDLPDAEGKTAYIYAVEVNNEELDALFLITPEIRAQLLSASEVKNQRTSQEATKQSISSLNDEELSTLHSGNHESLQEWRRQTDCLHSFLRKGSFATLTEAQSLEAYFGSTLSYVTRSNHLPQALIEKSLGIVKDYLGAIEGKKQQLTPTPQTAFFAAVNQDVEQVPEELWVHDEEVEQIMPGKSNRRI